MEALNSPNSPNPLARRKEAIIHHVQELAWLEGECLAQYQHVIAPLSTSPFVTFLWVALMSGLHKHTLSLLGACRTRAEQTSTCCNTTSREPNLTTKHLPYTCQGRYGTLDPYEKQSSWDDTAIEACNMAASDPNIANPTRAQAAKAPLHSSRPSSTPCSAPSLTDTDSALEPVDGLDNQNPNLLVGVTQAIALALALPCPTIVASSLARLPSLPRYLRHDTLSQCLPGNFNTFNTFTDSRAYRIIRARHVYFPDATLTGLP